MRIEPLSVQEALSRGGALPYALVRSLSGAALGPAPETVDLDELLEARFFGEEEEIRLFRGETGLQAVRLAQAGEETAIEVRRELANKSAFGRAVTMKQVLDFDEDGQAYIAYTRLTGWKGGN